MAPFQLFVGDELVYESDDDAGDIVGVRLHTARGEVARINSPLEESKVMVTLDRRSAVLSNYLDLEEDRVRRERAEQIEKASVEAFGERDPSDEEMGVGVDDPGARFAEQLAADREQASTPLAPEETQEPSFRPAVAEPGGELVQDQGVGDPAFEGARPLTVGEVEHPNFTGNQALTGQGPTAGDIGTGTPAGEPGAPAPSSSAGDELTLDSEK